MSTEKTLQIDSSKQEDTLKIAEQFGRACKGGEIFLLASDLGGGKTTFTKGLTKGLGSTDIVSSPTFMVSRVYECRGSLKLHHFDFYRLNEGGVVAYELAEILEDKNNVIAIEWGGIVTGVVPQDHITVVMDRTAEGEDARKITVTIPEKFAYMEPLL